MKLLYVNSLGKLNFLKINSLLFNRNYNINILFQFLIFCRSKLRTICSVQKNRTNMNYSTKKLYPQKGLGKSRAGSRSSPIRVGGARAFPGSILENFNVKFNKTMYKISLNIIYSQLFKENRILVIEDVFLVKPNSKLLLFKFYIMGLNDSLLFLTIKIEKNFFLSLRNLKNYKLVCFLKFNPLLLLKYSKILITNSSLFYIGCWF